MLPPRLLGDRTWLQFDFIFFSVSFYLIPACVWPRPPCCPREHLQKWANAVCIGVSATLQRRKTSGSQKRLCRGELGCAPLREIESGREKNGLVYLIDGRDRQGWCLLVIKIWSDTGMATIWFYLTMSGNKWVSSCATKAASHEASKKTHRAVRPAKSPPTVKDITTHPACRHATSLLLFLKPTAALAGKQLKLLMIS